MSSKSIIQETAQTVIYICCKCNASLKVSNKETILCKSCGNRILCKSRIDERLDFLAR